MADIFLLFSAFLAFALITTWLLKRFAGAQTFYVASLVRTTKLLPLLDRPLFLGKWLDRLCDLGFVLGFGALAVDYLHGRKRKLWQRAGIFVVSSALLFIFFETVFAAILSNPFIAGEQRLLSVFFALSGFAGFTVASLAAYAVFIISNSLAGQAVCPGIAPIIPGVDIPKVPVSVPLHAWISFFIILAVHEGMHGVLAKRFKVKIKSAGLLLLGILPIGAFVEPDEEKLKKIKHRNAIRIFCAGPTANLLSVLAIIIAANLVVALVLMPFVFPQAQKIRNGISAGIFVGEVEKEIGFCGKKYSSPASGILEKGMQIVAVNGVKVKTLAELVPKLQEKAANTFTVLDAQGNVSKKTIVPNELGQLGFAVEEKQKENAVVPQWYKAYSEIASFLASFFVWLAILSILVGIVNFLPVEPFDGGKIAKLLLLPYFSFAKMPEEDTKKLIGRILAWLVLSLLVINALPFILPF